MAHIESGFDLNKAYRCVFHIIGIKYIRGQQALVNSFHWGGVKVTTPRAIFSSNKHKGEPCLFEIKIHSRCFV